MNRMTIRTKIVITFICLVAAAQSDLLSQQYIWPTDASRALTSSFAEYRPGRFHAAIDIKTWGQMGYKVFAVRPGYVSRIRVSPYGYGKAIYLSLDTGETVVYGHLQRFNDAIEKYVRAEQEKRGQYSIQLFPNANRFPVQQGDLLGYTGQTGVGYPHLHFEIRDQYNRPINPLLRGYKVADTRAPVISKIAITPLDAFSTVQGDWKPLVLRPVRVKGSHYRLPKTIRVSGRVGFELSAYDQMNGITNKFGIYATRLFIDNRMVFSARYDRFSYYENNQSNLDRDFRLYVQGRGLFYKLFRDVGNRLSFYLKDDPYYGVVDFNPNRGDGPLASAPQRQRDGILSMGKGYHKLRIETEDFWGNLSVVTGTLYAGQKKQLALALPFNDGEEGNIPRVEITNVDDDFDLVSVYLSTDTGRTWKLIMNRKADEADLSSREKGGSPTLPLPAIQNSQNVCLKVVAKDSNGFTSYPAYAFIDQWSRKEGAKSVNFEVSPEFYDTYIRLQFQTSQTCSNMPTVMGRTHNGGEKKIDLVQADPRTFIGAWPLQPADPGPLTLKITATNARGEEYMQQILLPFVTVRKGERKSVRTDDGLCVIDFSPNSLFRDIFVRTKVVDSLPKNDYDIVGKLYRIDPADVPLDKGATIALQYPADDTLASKLAIYYKVRKNGWRFLANRFRDGYISGQVKSFGTYCLIRDVQPPLIYSLSPAQGARLTSANPMLKARFEDKLSGISGEENMLLKLDGRKVIAEYDPEENLLFYKVTKPLAKGKHTLQLTVIDRCGNKAERAHTFWVD